MNIDVNVKSELIKDYVINNLFGILVIVSMNLIKLVMLVNIDYKHSKCGKKLLDKLVDECTETIEEVTLAKITLAENEVLAQCILCYFGFFFTINVGGIGANFIYFCGYLRNMFARETTVYYTYKWKKLNK